MKIRSNSGFSMMEMIVVIGLIGAILAYIGPKIAQYITKSEDAQIKLKMSGIKEALQEYRMEFGAYPTSREGLRALVENPRPNDERYKRAANKWPFLKEDQIADKAGNDFMYSCPPERFKGKYKQFEIVHLGPTQSEDDPERKDDGI
jgi:general secretion pathway protein G